MLWALAFCFLLTSLNFITSLIAQSLKDKPLGSQSIFDSSIRDTLIVMRCYGSLASTMCIFGRFDWCQNFFLNNKVFLIFGSVMFSFGLIALCVNAGKTEKLRSFSPSFCLCFFVSFCLSLSVCLSLFVSLCLSLFVCLSLSMSASVCLCVSLFVSVSLFRSVSLC